jgi:hypothetical protein
MANETNARKVGLLVLLLAVLAGVVVLRVRPALLEGVRGGSGALPVTGTYHVPVLAWRDEGGGTTAGEGGTGRNIFTFGPPPTPTPDPRPTPTPAPTLPPRPQPTPTFAGVVLPDGKRLPPPPRFTLSYLGWLGPDRLPVGVFRDGEEVLAVPRGEVIAKVFILRDVGPTDATIGFVGYPETVLAKVQISR